MLDLVDRDVQAAGRHLSLKMPRDLEALFTEEAFAHDEFVPYWAELWPSALVLADVLPTELTGGCACWRSGRASACRRCARPWPGTT